MPPLVSIEATLSIQLGGALVLMIIAERCVNHYSILERKCEQM